MRKVLWGLVWAACLWCGYWFFGAYSLKNGTQSWLDEQRRTGWAADVAQVETTGFPTRFTTTLTDVRLADPRSGVGWKAPQFEFATKAYKLNQVYVTFPPTHRFIAPGQTLDVTSDALTATLRLRPQTSLALDHVQADLQNLALRSNTGWMSDIENGVLSASRVEGTDATYDLTFRTENWQPGQALKALIDPQNRLPDVFQVADIQARVAFDRPWDRFALEQQRPQPRTIDIKLAQATWGALNLGLAGALTVDAQGLADGKVTVKATNWQDLLALSVENGSVPAQMSGFLEGALKGLSQASGPANTLDVPITISNGQMRLGFIPLGPAPRFILR